MEIHLKINGREETWRAAPSLDSARRQVRCSLMGGIHPTTLVSGREADVRAQVRAALEQTQGWRLVLAPTGPLPPRARPELIAALREAVAADLPGALLDWRQAEQQLSQIVVENELHFDCRMKAESGRACRAPCRAAGTAATAASAAGPSAAVRAAKAALG